MIFSDQETLVVQAYAQLYSFRAECRTVGYTFIVTELELGITFCQSTVNTADCTKRERNQRNAMRALNTASRFISAIDWDSQTRSDLEQMAADLKRVLASV